MRRRPCASHPSLDREALCDDCGAPMCAVYVLTGGPRCERCRKARRRRLHFRNLRIAGLLVLGAVLCGALLIRARSLEERTSWERPLVVSVVLIADRAIPPGTDERWRRGLRRLEAWFSSQWSRYRPSSPSPMVTFSLDDVVTLPELPSLPEAGDGARGAIALDLVLRTRLDLRSDRDAVIVVALGEGEGAVEGVAEAGGSLALVLGALHDPDVALELTAVAHEVLHCLGATDKYDAAGHAQLPEGLAEPAKAPWLPQRYAEVMVGEVPLAAWMGRPIVSLDEVAIGPVTAREIRW